jgi:integrase
MAGMGRRRKVDEGLEPRVYRSHGALFYVHPGTPPRWERLGTDKDAANAKARTYNDPANLHGTLSWWMDQFIVDCERRVKLKSTVKGIKLSQRTLEDYQDAFGTREEPGPVREYFAPPRTPLDVTPGGVQEYLRAEAEAGRPVQGNRRRAALSACISWILRHPERPAGLLVNPCLRGSGVQRNPESKRERYVPHDEYNDVYACASRAVRLMMELTYRTLQRPESDIIRWDRREVVKTRNGKRVLDFVQHKTGRHMVIAFSDELDALLPADVVTKLHEAAPLVRTLKGEFYTYGGLCTLLKDAIAVANVRRKARGHEPIASFGFRDLKGKGATDMWLAKVPVEEIQALLGHANKTTTEIYVKQRWREAAQPNTVRIA